MATKKITKQEAKKLAIKAGVNFKKDYFEQDITTVLKNIGALQGYKHSKSSGRSYGQSYFYYLQKLK